MQQVIFFMLFLFLIQFHDSRKMIIFIDQHSAKRKKSFPSRMSSKDISKSTGNFRFVHICWWNAQWKTLKSSKFKLVKCVFYMALYVMHFIHCFLHNFICAIRFLTMQDYLASDDSKLIFNLKRNSNLHTGNNRYGTIFLKLDTIKIDLHRKIMTWFYQSSKKKIIKKSSIFSKKTLIDEWCV